MTDQSTFSAAGLVLANSLAAAATAVVSVFQNQNNCFVSRLFDRELVIHDGFFRGYFDHGLSGQEWTDRKSSGGQNGWGAS